MMKTPLEAMIDSAMRMSLETLRVQRELQIRALSLQVNALQQQVQSLQGALEE